MRSTWFVSLGVVVVGLASLTPAGGQDAPLPRRDLAGKLEGKVLYTNGQEARVEVELAAGERPRTFVGTYTLTLITEDAPQRKQGEVTATVEGDRVRATFDGLEATGSLTAADPHAVFALYGTFAEPGGVFLLYRYRR